MAFKMHDDARTTLEPKTPESNKSVLGIGHQQITRTPEVQIPQIMERPMRLLVPIGRVPTMRARVPYVVATVGGDLGLWQVCGCGDPGAWVGAVLTWTVHRVALLAHRFGPELYAKHLRGATRCSRYSLAMCMILSTIRRRNTHVARSTRTGQSVYFHCSSPTCACFEASAKRICRGMWDSSNSCATFIN